MIVIVACGVEVVTSNRWMARWFWRNVYDESRARRPPSEAWRELVVVFLPFHRSRKNSKAEGHQRGQKHVRASFSNILTRASYWENVHSWSRAPKARWKKLVYKILILNIIKWSIVMINRLCKLKLQAVGFINFGDN